MINAKEITISSIPIYNAFGSFSEHREGIIKMIERDITHRAKMGYNYTLVSLLSYFGVMDVKIEMTKFILELSNYLERHGYEVIEYKGGMYYDFIVFF